MVSHSSKVVNNVIYNGNWTEWSEIWLEIICVISKLNAVQRKFDLKSQVWFQTKIADFIIDRDRSLWVVVVNKYKVYNSHFH